jgi:hypothetical protein
MPGPVVRRYGSSPNFNAGFLFSELYINGQWSQPTAVPGCSRHLAIACFQILRIFNMGYNFTAVRLPNCISTTGMVKMTMRQQQMRHFALTLQTVINIGNEVFMRPTAASVHKGGLTSAPNQIDCRIAGCGQTITTDLP